MALWEKAAIGVLLVGATCYGCAGRLIQYEGMPGNAAAMTYCDNTGTIRTVMDAQMIGITSEGRLVTNAPLGEILIHEAVHRAQLEARRTAPGVCPPDATLSELVGMEVEAYCAGFQFAVSHGANPLEVGMRYGRSFVNQFSMWWKPQDVQGHIAPRWASVCPTYQLLWNEP